MATDGVGSRVLVVRHGDRFDYARPEWRERAAELGLNPRDPPLSQLGWRQAAEAAAEIQQRTREWGRVDAILVSPYLRVIQTALPLARRLGLPLCIEEGLAETHHTPGLLPDAVSRFAYFPEVDTTYESVFPVVADGCAFGKHFESYPIGYMRRMLSVADTFTRAFEGKNIICFTHAASIALVSGFLGTELPTDESFKFAPCGIFHLERPLASISWELRSNGFDNTTYVTENSPTTSPWGFSGVKLHVWNALIRERSVRPAL